MGGNDIGTWAVFVVGSIVALLIGLNIGGEVTGSVTNSLTACDGHYTDITGTVTNATKGPRAAKPNDFCQKGGIITVATSDIDADGEDKGPFTGAASGTCTGCSYREWQEPSGIVNLGRTVLSFFPVLYYSSLFAIPGAIGMMLYKKMNV